LTAARSSPRIDADAVPDRLGDELVVDGIGGGLAQIRAVEDVVRPSV